MKFIKILKLIVKIFIIAVASFWIGSQLIGVIFFQPTIDFITSIVGEDVLAPIFSDYTVSNNPSEIIQGVGKIFDTSFYAIYSIISIVAAILGTIILSKKRGVIEILAMLGAFAIPNERTSWGSVRDADTKKSIPFAIIRLTKKTENDDVIQTVSDLDGRYRIYINDTSSDYDISVHAAGYEDLISTLDIYWDPTKSNLFIQDLYLNKLSKTQKKFGTGFNYLRPRIYWYLIITFYILSFLYFAFGILYIVAFPDSVYGIAQMAVFAIAFVWNSKIIWERTHSMHGKLINTSTQGAVLGTKVDLYDKDTRIANALSDDKGQIKFDVNPGDYQLRLASNIYKLEGKGQFIDITVDKDGYVNKNIHVVRLDSLDLASNKSQSSKNSNNANNANSSNSSGSSRVKGKNALDNQEQIDDNPFV